ncbi:MAG: hypothetical protein KGZ35_02690 [Truepera sp.]|nr:hypothetical protein [Truepera sp.]
MAEGITMQLREIAAYRGEALDALQLRELTKKAARLTTVVRNNWPTLTDDEKQTLRAFAYLIIEPPRDMQRKLLEGLGYAMLFLDDSQALRGYAASLAQLVEEILDQLERESPVLQKAVADALEEVFANPTAGESIPPGEELDYLQSISNKAFRRI